jgi:3-oxoacyl-[acyl-carrier-protein] synthase-3
LADYDDAEIGELFENHGMIDKGQNRAVMDGPAVFKKAIVKFPEVVMEALDQNGYSPADIKLLIPHQANLRISQFVQHQLKLRDDQVFNNIQKYGNTTAASIPLACAKPGRKERSKKAILFALQLLAVGLPGQALY